MAACQIWGEFFFVSFHGIKTSSELLQRKKKKNCNNSVISTKKQQMLTPLSKTHSGRVYLFHFLFQAHDPNFSQHVTIHDFSSGLTMLELLTTYFFLINSSIHVSVFSENDLTELHSRRLTYILQAALCRNFQVFKLTNSKYKVNIKQTSQHSLFHSLDVKMSVSNHKQAIRLSVRQISTVI